MPGQTAQALLPTPNPSVPAANSTTTAFYFPLRILSCAAAQYHLIESIRSEVQAVLRLRRERDSLLRMFLHGE